MRRAFIFDLDGVITDTAKYHYLAWKELAAELGYDFSKEQGERLKGVSRMQSLEIVLESCSGLKLTQKEKECLAEQKNQHYLHMIERLTSADILPGIEIFLRNVKKEGFLTALGSASKSGRMILEKLGIRSLFDVVVDGNIIQKAKPDPEVFLKAAGLLETEPGHCIVIEDARAGVEAAKAGGMYCIAIGEERYLKQADLVLHSTGQLAGIKLNELLETLEGQI